MVRCGRAGISQAQSRPRHTCQAACDTLSLIRYAREWSDDRKITAGQAMHSGWANVSSSLGWTPSRVLRDIGDAAQVRARRYAEFVRSAIPPGEWEMIRSALQRGQLTGNERFVDEVAAITGRRIAQRQQGRPRLESEKKICPLFSFLATCLRERWVPMTSLP